MGETAINGLSPEVVQRQIRDGVANGIMSRARMKPYTMTGPYRMVLKVKTDKPLYPGTTRPRDGESVFEHADLLELGPAAERRKSDSWT